MVDQTVKVAIQITSHLQGKMHIQTNPYFAYSTDKTVANAFRKTVYIPGRFLHSDIVQASSTSSKSLRLTGTVLESASRFPALGKVCWLVAHYN